MNIRLDRVEGDAGGELGPDPKVSLVELRQKFLAEPREEEQRERDAGAPAPAACGTCRSTRRPGGLCSPSGRMMFSVMMTAPSTMMPKSMAPSDRRFAGIPRRSMKMKAKRSDSGIVSATMNAAR